MSSREPVVVAQFENSADAHVARIRLEDAGIKVALVGETVADSLWHMNPATGGVRLIVQPENVEQARAILAADETSVATQKNDGGSSWRCKSCDEIVDAGFEVCWSCGRSFDEVHDPDYSPDSPTPDDANDADHDVASFQEPPAIIKSAEAFPTASNNPYESSRATRSADHDSTDDLLSSDSDENEQLEKVREEIAAAVNRAYRASIIGLFWFCACPAALHLYSSYILLTTTEHKALMPAKIRRRYQIAWFINLVTLAVAGVLYYVSVMGFLRY